MDGALIKEILQYMGGTAGIAALVAGIIKAVRYWRQDNAEASIKEQEAKRMATETNILSKNSAVQSLEAVNASLIGEINRIESRFNKFYDEHVQTLAHLERCERERRLLAIESEAEKRRLLEQYHGLLREHNQLKADHNHQKEENTKMRVRVDELEREVDELRERLSASL